MQTYIAILRGINVSGQKIIKMAELRDHLGSLGFSNLATYIQSGNIVFQSAMLDNHVLEDKIHQKIKANYGFDVPVFVRSQEEWQYMVEQNPFLTRKGIELNKLHVTILGVSPTSKSVEGIDATAYLPDEYVVSGPTVYVYCPNGYGKTKLNNTFFEKKLNTPATTRNWKTYFQPRIVIRDLSWYKRPAKILGFIPNSFNPFSFFHIQ